MTSRTPVNKLDGGAARDGKAAARSSPIARMASLRDRLEAGAGAPRRGRSGAFTARRMLVAAVALGAVVAAFAAPGEVSAATFCVTAPTCPGGGIDKGDDVQAALDATQFSRGPDEVLVGDRGAPYVGPFVYPTGAVPAEETVDITASGPGRPLLTAGAGQTVLSVGGVTLEGIDVRLPSAAAGVGIETGSTTLRDVRVTGPGGGVGARGIIAFADTNLIDVQIKGTGFRGLEARSGDIDADSLRVDDVGIGVTSQDNADLVLTGARVVAGDVALSSRGNTIAVRSLLQTTDPDSDGVSAGGGGLTLDHVTVAHRGPVNGNDSALRFINVDIPGRATIGAVALAGYTRGIKRETQTGEPYPVAIRDSVWDPARDILGGPELGRLDESGNAHVSPAFVGLAEGDFRPRFGSAVIDRDPLAGGRFTDLDGSPAVDGDGDGSVRADSGAFEYRRRAPTIDTANVPSAGTAGVPLAFAATGSDPDGDGVEFAWVFGDGGGATGAKATHAYAAPGTNQVTLLVTDDAGITATRSFTVTIGGGGDVGGGGGNEGGGNGGVNAAPVLSAVRLSTQRVKVKRAAGLRLRFRLSEKATVRIAPRRLRGRRSVAVRGAIVRRAKAGANSIGLARPLRRLRLLRAGRLSLTVTATDAEGNRSKRRVVRLTLRP
jgi:hypothetical protein